MKRGSMSVTSTDPEGPTRSAIQAATEPLPPPDAGRLQEAEGAEIVERVEAREALCSLGHRGVVEDVGAYRKCSRGSRAGAPPCAHLLLAALRSTRRAISPT